MPLARTKPEIMASYPTCYACEAARTSMEHAPPECFFPYDKDAQGHFVYRQDLIKVPSCDKHNSKKSNDDVYALWHLAAADGVNEYGSMVRGNLLKRMADRDWKQRGGALMRRLLSEVTEFSDGRPVARCDAERMKRFLICCAKAVFFYDYYEKLMVPLRVTNTSNDFRDAERASRLKDRESFFDGEMKGAETRGNNPGVFQYSIHRKSPDDIILVRLVFYGTLKHWVYHHPQAG